MTLDGLSTQLASAFESLNHHQVDLDDIVLKKMATHYPNIECSQKDFNIEVYENFDWGETLFDLTWTTTFTKAFAEVYPEAVI